MVKQDERIDTYIENAKPFARPILKHLRKLLHKACPKIEETIKWSFPHFDYEGPICHMAAFKEHCSFGFWKATIMQDSQNILDKSHENAMGQFGRITDLKDLPPDDVIIEYIKEAMKLNELGIKVPKKTPSKVSEIIVPDDLAQALKKNRKAKETFDNFSNSKKKDYVEWITEAKQAATRTRRLETAIEWMNEGKSKNWKYEKC